MKIWGCSVVSICYTFGHDLVPSGQGHSPCEWKRSIFAMCANTYGRRRQIGLRLTPSKSSQWVPGPFPRDVKLIKLNYVMSRHSLQGGGYPPLSNQNGWLYPDNMDEASFHMHGFMSKYYQSIPSTERKQNETETECGPRRICLHT